MKFQLAAALSATLCLAPDSDADIRLAPNPVYLFDAAADRNLVDAVLHNLVIVNDDESTITLNSIRIELVENGNAISASVLSRDQISSRAERLASFSEAGVLDLLDFQFRLSNLLTSGETLSNDTALEAGEAVLITSTYLAAIGSPDGVRITATGLTAAGDTWHEVEEFTVSRHVSPNTYRSPLNGRWFVFASGDAHHHHRWVISSEYALDIAQLGPDMTTHTGSGQAFEDFHAYGQPVYAVADGRIVSVANDIAEDTSTLRQPGENLADYDARAGQYQQGILLSAGLEAGMGNHVVVEHAGGEYSVYAHLQTGSVIVAAGDTVTSGQMVGRLGSSGNSTEPHLHFQMNDGPDPVTARGLPVVFDGLDDDWISSNNRHIRAGHIMDYSPSE